MLYLAHLGPETIAEIGLEDEEEEEESVDTQVEKECFSAHCQSTITGTECHPAVPFPTYPQQLLQLVSIPLWLIH